MTRVVHLARSRTYPAGVERTFETLLPYDLSRFFERRFAAVPAVKRVEGPTDGPWGRPGQVRTVVLMGGGSMREELREVRSPHLFAYHLDELSGPMRLLVRSVDGAFELEKAGTGVRITWRWAVVPRNGAAARAMPLFARMWQGYARQALDGFERVLVG